MLQRAFLSVVNFPVPQMESLLDGPQIHHSDSLHCTVNIEFHSLFIVNPPQNFPPVQIQIKS